MKLQEFKQVVYPPTHLLFSYYVIGPPWPPPPPFAGILLIFPDPGST